MIDREVEEIRARRRDLLKKRYAGSIDRFIRDAQEWQRKHKTKTVTLAPRRKIAV